MKACVRTAILGSWLMLVALAVVWIRSYFVSDSVHVEWVLRDATPFRFIHWHSTTLMTMPGSVVLLIGEDYADSPSAYSQRPTSPKWKITHKNAKLLKDEADWNGYTWRFLGLAYYREAAVERIHVVQMTPEEEKDQAILLAVGKSRAPAMCLRHSGLIDVRIPLWMALVLTGCPTLARLLGPVRRRRKRRRKGLCLKCGYDLSGGRGQCPECGTGAAEAAPPNEAPVLRGSDRADSDATTT
jgi:hypothetical protein